jgi:hypothetical protein
MTLARCCNQRCETGRSPTRLPTPELATADLPVVHRRSQVVNTSVFTFMIESATTFSR